MHDRKLDDASTMSMSRIFQEMTYYDPANFWSNYAKEQIKDGITATKYNTELYELQNARLMELLKHMEFKSVLEIGSGMGRITKMILDNFQIEEYAILDISAEFVNALLHNVDLKKYSTKSYHIVIGDITDPTVIDSFGNKEFDLVIAVEVLMHIKPRDIYNTLGSLMYLSKRNVVNLDYCTDKDVELRNHNFNHDYESMYKSYNDMCVKFNAEPLGDTDQVLFNVIMK